MKLESIQLRNFLSHEATDFDLNGARLATIVGANGAGKSSLLDGVAYALFDSARGRTDDLVTLGQVEMSAAVEFTYAGARYRVTRGRTAKAGGKSYLELAIADVEGWRPLTDDSIRETQAKIAALLRIDEATFDTAVMLGQGRMNAFAEATPSARKRILSTVLGLDVYGRAEAEAKARVANFENQLANGRAEASRLDDELASVPELEASLIAHREAIAHHTSEVERLTAARALAASQLLDLASEIAGLDAARSELTALEDQLVQLRVDYAAARQREDTAAETLRAETAVLASAAEVEAAVERAASLRFELDVEIGRQVSHAGLESEIRRRSDAVASAQADQDRTLATYQATRHQMSRHLDDLIEAHRGLRPVTCPKCGKGIVVDQAGLARRIAEARLELEALQEPKVGIRVDRERAQIVSLERKRDALRYDPARLTALHTEAAAVAATAARSERIEAARASVASAGEAIMAAEQERASIDARGREIAARLPALRRHLAGAKALERQARLGRDHAQLELELAEAQRALTIVTAMEARDAAHLEKLHELARKRAILAAAISSLERGIGQLRKLVAAFGVTGIPARVIESVLPELTSHAQALLDELRPGMTLELRAQRAKKDGKGLIEALDLIIRDSAGERPLALFSGGERMSVSLAIAVGLSRLIARRAGTALRTLFIDEPDGLDTEARRAFGQALRILAHQGELERVLVVSHHEDLAEVGDAQFRVEKNGHGSVVTEL